MLNNTNNTPIEKVLRGVVSDVVLKVSKHKELRSHLLYSIAKQKESSIYEILDFIGYPIEDQVQIVAKYKIEKNKQLVSCKCMDTNCNYAK